MRVHEQAAIRAPAEKKVGIKDFQGRIDRETRTAMKAAMGLEKCIVDMLSDLQYSNKGATHSDLFGHLSELKSYLWHMLVMSMADDLA